MLYFSVRTMLATVFSRSLKKENKFKKLLANEKGKI